MGYHFSTKALFCNLVTFICIAKGANPTPPIAVPNMIGGNIVTSSPLDAQPVAKPLISVSFDAVPGQFPSIASIIMPNAFCGGVLIAPNAVLTAAHCISAIRSSSSRLLSDTRIQIGCLKRTSCTQPSHRVAALYAHPKYNPLSTKITNDIGIIILKTPSTVSAIKMATEKPAVGTVQRLAGWGLTAQTLEVASNLQYTDVTILAHRNCTFPSTNFYAPWSSICGNSRGSWPNNYTASSCVGDSGGPLVRRKASGPSEELYGIIAYGVKKDETSKCGQYIRSVFMSTSFYKAWIEKTLYAANRPPNKPPPRRKRAPPPPKRRQRAPPSAKQNHPLKTEYSSF